jgi:Mg-chelatase subunit ChlD
MPRRKRKPTTFSLSFLDIMSCGLGAVVLLYLIIDHASDVHFEEANYDLLAEVSLLEEEVLEGKDRRVKVRNTIAAVDQQMAEAQGLARRIIDEALQSREEMAELKEDSLSRIDHINQLQTELENLEEESERLAAQGEQQDGENVRQFLGEGDRQYLTGLKLGGRRLLILLDASASMLDESIVNIIRMRNMPEATRKNSAKWLRAVATVDWLAAQLPKNSDYQLYTFNTDVSASIEGTLGQWLPINDSEQLNEAVENLSDIVPNGGTSLEDAFMEVGNLVPRPDNIYLITDGLPTQGRKGAKGLTVSGKKRLQLYNQALQELPTGIPVNIILAPMEGDYMAASAFWRLAQATGGSFLSPSRDWP